MPSADRIAGIHAVREALRARSRPIQYLALSHARQDARLRELEQLARENGVAVRRLAPPALERLAGSPRHQGAVAVLAAKARLSVEELLQRAAAPGLLVALDGIEDPHNLGAILRSAAGAGAQGVILPRRRSAPLGETAARVSAGALEHLAAAETANIAAALEKTAAAGYWSVALDADAPQPYWAHDFRGPTVLVIGAEGAGLHRLVRERCDFAVSIPLAPGPASLNASVAAAVVLFEVVRQRAAGQAGR